MSRDGISVAILTPCRGGIDPEHVSTLLGLTAALHANRIPWQWIPEMARPVSTARNRLVHRARATSCSHFLWLDGDVAFKPDVVGELLGLDVDVCCVAYLARPNAEGVRTRERSYSVCLVDLDQAPVRGAVKVRHTGFGALLMRREVLERLTAAHPELECADNYGADGETHALFAEMIEDGVRLSEDVSFCRRWAALGGTIHVLLDADTSHGQAGIGNYRHDVWDRRDELRGLRAEMVRLDDQAQALRADLLAARTPDPKVAALIASVPRRRGPVVADVNRSPEQYAPIRDAMATTVAAMRAELARLREPAPAKVAPSLPPVRTLAVPANRRAPCPCGSGERFTACHGPTAETAT